MLIDDEKSRRTAVSTKLQSRPKTGDKKSSNGDRKNSNGPTKNEDILLKTSAEIPHYMKPCGGSCHDACKLKYQAASDAPGRAALRTINGGSYQSVSKFGGKGKVGGAEYPSGSRSCPAKIGRSFGTPKAVLSANSRKLRCEACRHRQQTSVEATGSPRTPQRSVTVCSEPYSRRRKDEDSANCKVKCEAKLSDADSEVKSEVKLLDNTAEQGKWELPAVLTPGGVDSAADETKTEFKINGASDAKKDFKIAGISDEAKGEFKVDSTFDANKDFNFDSVSDEAKRELKVDCASDASEDFKFVSISDEANREFNVYCDSEANKDFKMDNISDAVKMELKVDCVTDDTKRKFKREGRADRHFGDEIHETGNVVLKHRDVAGRKASEDWMVDHVVEEAVNKLARCEESKVKAVVGAFESVISYTVK